MGRMSGWRSLRRFALLAASILSSCFLLTEGQSTITPVKIVLQPPHPAIGQNVTLTPTTTPGDMENAVVCYWYRGLETLDNKLIFTYFFVPKPVQTDGPVFTGRETAGPGCSLHIRNLTSEDTGNYTVTVSVPGKNLKGQASLTVSEPVTKIIITGPDKAFENNITVLNCSSEGSNVSYYWSEWNKSPDMIRHIFLSNDNKTLTFNQTMRADSGNYTCHGFNSFSEANYTYYLDVLYGPDVPVISPTTSEYAEGDNFSLSCDADSNPPAQYTWFINGSVEAGNTTQLLRFNLSFSDSGNYTCHAFNNETNNNNISNILEIYVLEKLSSPVLWPSDVTVAENANLTLNCTTSNNPGVSVSWFKDGKPLLSGLSDRNRTLTLISVTRNDAGLYTCNASNPVSFAMSNSAKITVAYGPAIKLNPEGTVEKSLNSELKLECTADSVPAARFQWYFNNTTLNANESIFKVPFLNWTDEGNYTCQATNPFTNHRAMRTAYVKLTKDEGGGSNGGLSGGAIAGIVIGTLAGVILIAGLLYYICTKTSIGRMELHASNGNVPSAPGQNQGVTDTKPKAGEEDLQYSILAFKDTNRSPPRPTSEASQPSESGIIYSEIKKK